MVGRMELIASLVFSCQLIIFSMGMSAADADLCDKEDITMTFLKTEADAIERIKQSVLSGTSRCSKENRTMPTDCAEVQRSGHNKSGVYTIWPNNRIIEGNVMVYCDMETDGGGWTAIQRRGDYGRPDDYFYKDWDSYKRGFGDIREDFWLGNDLIHAITNQRRYSIRFDLSGFEGDKRYALYDNFWIEGEGGQYRLHITDYSGDAGDSMGQHDNMKFTTTDRDNDRREVGNCAELRKGSWWYANCYFANLNGLYLKGGKGSYGMDWKDWKGYNASLKTTEMKIRPK